MGAEVDDDRNDGFYSYFASWPPKIIPSLEGSGSGPNFWNRTIMPQRANARDHIPTTPGAIQIPLTAINATLKSKANAGGKRDDFSMGRFSQSESFSSA